MSDEADRVLCRRRLPNELGKVLEALEPHRAELVGVVVESTYNWYWLVDGLQAAGYRVHLANTAAKKPYDGLKHSDDESVWGFCAPGISIRWLSEGLLLHAQERRALRCEALLPLTNGEGR